jgi:Flp pilus assembly pilin Flp
MSSRAIAVMKRFNVLRLRDSEDGQDLLEYGLLVALIALVAFGAVATVGTTIQTVFWEVIAGAF